MIKFKLSIVAIVFLLQGCATNAQNQFALMQQKLQDASVQLQACVDPIDINPLYVSIRQRTPADLLKTPPNILQLSDNSFPNDEDIKKFISMYSEATLCKQLNIKNYMDINQKISATLTESATAGDLLAADFIQKKLSWGDYNKKRMSIYREISEKLDVIYSLMKHDLEQSHQAEMQQRQQASQIASNQIREQNKMNLQQQQIQNNNTNNLINSFGNNRQTTCRSNMYGGTVTTNCN